VEKPYSCSTRGRSLRDKRRKSKMICALRVYPDYRVAKLPKAVFALSHPCTWLLNPLLPAIMSEASTSALSASTKSTPKPASTFSLLMSTRDAYASYKLAVDAFVTSLAPIHSVGEYVVVHSSLAVQWPRVCRSRQLLFDDPCQLLKSSCSGIPLLASLRQSLVLERT
jgi:hypothetical protein